MSKKIGDLPAVITPASGDLFETVQSGTSKKETRTQIVAGVQGSLDTHIADATVHLTGAQNTWLDTVQPAVTAVQMGYVAGVTSAIQTQLNILTSAKATYIAPALLGTVSIADNGASAGHLAFISAGPFIGTLTWTYTANRAITLPDSAGELTILGNTTTGTGNIVRATSPTISGATLSTTIAITGNPTITGRLQGATPLIFDGATTGDANLLNLAVTDPTAVRTITLPDATGTVVLANDLTDYNKFIGLGGVINFATGTWTTTRIAEGNYVKRHTAADETSIIGIDITESIRSATSKGLKLASIDVIYSIGTAAMDAHTLTLDQITYQNNAAVTVTSVPLTGSLATATQANPYVSNIAITTPAYLNDTKPNKYVLEITANQAATTTYDYYGINLKFTRNDF